jgi:hypothetical protein
VEAVWGSLIAVLGTLFGSLSTFVYQRKATERAEAVAREERVRQERLAAYGAFAGAVGEFKRGMVSQWFRSRADRDGPTHMDAIAESDRLAAVTETALFRMQMVSDATELADLAELAEQAYAGARRVRRAADSDDLKEREREFEARMRAFTAAVSTHLR